MDSSNNGETKNESNNDSELAEDAIINIECPHCNGQIIVSLNELNCKIFRHGIYKHNYEQINPHLNKQECDRLVENNLIFGCGKPFILLYKNNEFYTEICGYI